MVEAPQTGANGCREGSRFGFAYLMGDSRDRHSHAHMGQHAGYQHPHTADPLRDGAAADREAAAARFGDARDNLLDVERPGGEKLDPLLMRASDAIDLVVVECGEHDEAARSYPQRNALPDIDGHGPNGRLRLNAEEADRLVAGARHEIAGEPGGVRHILYHWAPVLAQVRAGARRKSEFEGQCTDMIAAIGLTEAQQAFVGKRTQDAEHCRAVKARGPRDARQRRSRFLQLRDGARDMQRAADSLGAVAGLYHILSSMGPD